VKFRVRSVVVEGCAGAGTGPPAEPEGAGVGVGVAVGGVRGADWVVRGVEPPPEFTSRTTAIPSATAATTTRARVPRGERQKRRKALTAAAGSGRGATEGPSPTRPPAGGAAAPGARTAPARPPASAADGMAAPDRALAGGVAGTCRRVDSG